MKLAESIVETLKARFSPEYVEVLNESHNHGVPPNSETHFKVVIATESFQGKSLVARHRAVYDALAYAMNGGVHALALHTYTPEEWARRSDAPASPNCMGGSKG